MELPWLPDLTAALALWPLQLTGVCKRTLAVLQDNWDDEEEEEEVKETEVKQGETEGNPGSVSARDQTGGV